MEEIAKEARRQYIEAELEAAKLLPTLIFTPIRFVFVGANTRLSCVRNRLY